MKKLKNSIWGIILILIGVLVALKVLDVIAFNIFFDGFWTLFIIIPCAVGLITERDKKGNLIGLFIGVCLLLACQNIIDFDMIWKLIVPVVLVVIGLSLIFGDALNKEVSKKIKTLTEQNGGKYSAEYNAMFSGENLNFSGEHVDSMAMNAVFGGLKADFRGALVDADIVIQASAIFGGIDIYVPENVNVKVQPTALFGGVGGSKIRTVSPTAPTLYINASALFGGVTIK